MCFPLLLAVVSFVSAAELKSSAARKVDEISKVMDVVWIRHFAILDHPPDSPKLVGFTKTSTSLCGRLPAGNAYYCEKDHTIYYDSEFLEVLRRRIAADTGTDGDAAPVVALAHEFGHAIYARPGAYSNPRVNGYGQEKLADCFAGVVVREAFETGLMKASDLREAEQTMIVIGEGLHFRERSSRRHRTEYPNWRVRRDRFLSGLKRGPDGCALSPIENLSGGPAH